MYPLSAILQVLFPTTCACCGNVLVHGERQLCLQCLSNLESTLYSPVPGNPVERRLMELPSLGNATATYFFRHDNTVRDTVHAMKFHGNTELCLIMGRQMGLNLLASGRFDDVEVLVPVPLHWWRRLHRGYNQSELLCRGIAEVMHLPVCTDAVVRHRYTRQQSQQQGSKRAQNVAGAFRLRKASRIEGKHVLLVDDVLTTGATIKACATAMSSAEGVRISVATFSVAS